ncbi:MAG: aldo/keto reductase [Verrucomicrobia bacterium]|nr:aldo/keto reductase [Verrucomicrobiota bacterium]MCH8512170.1 aldo/keto reductase [Kiritimatiellia bacterium]
MNVKHTRLGKHGVVVSNLCLGTMNFGARTEEKEAFAIMDRALELGINFFDTADVYGGDAGRGATERILGRWFAQGGGRREAVVLATKVYNAADSGDDLPEPNHNSRNLSAMKIKRHCEDSLRRLQTDVIDLYQMHHVDRDCPWDEAWQAFSALVNQGKIVYVGSSNFAGWDIATACQEADRRGMCGLVSEQSIYNLTNRHVELEVVPACRGYGLGLIPWSPLGGGLLGGALKGESGGRRSGKGFADRVEKHRDQLERYEALCKELGESPGVVALAWLLHNPVVTAPIIGPRTVAQLDSAVRATEITLDKDTMNALDEIWPGPGGEAPNAYAW